MKRNRMVLAAAVLIAFGAVLPAAAKQVLWSSGEPPTGKPAVAGDSTNSGDARGQQMAFQKVDIAAARPAVQRWVAEKKAAPGIHSATIEGKTYILVSRGQKPNTGYGIAIRSVMEEPDRLVVRVELRDPQPGMMYAQVITTPTDLVAVPPTDKPVVLE